MIVDRGRVAAALLGYTLGEQLGAGAFGLVLAAEHRRMGRSVAVKVMPAEGPEGVSVDFAAEARVLAGLDHPHVVRAYDYIEAGGLCLVVMELLSGGTLTRRREGMGPGQACAVGLAVAAALHHAHGRGVLHRDVKMDNILFAADGTPKVTDFGIAKMFEGSAATASGMAGTPLYMAPEQIEGGRLGPATDLYALGMLLYRLLTGTAPFDPNQPVNLLWRQHLNDPPPPMDGVPAPVADVVLRALAKNPADRQTDARAFAVDLADAAVHVYGPGWTGRAGIPLYLDDTVRRASESPPLPPAADGTALEPARGGTGRGGPPAGGSPGTREPDVAPDAAETARPIGATGTLPTVRGTAVADGDVPRAGTPGTRPPGRNARWRGLARRRVVLAGTVVLAVLALTAGSVLFLLPGGDSDEAVSRRLAAEASAVAADQRDLARRLAVAAYRTAPTREARTGVLSLLASIDQPLATFTGHTSGVDDVVFSPDGTLLATSGGEDGTARLWDTTGRGTVEPLATITANTDWLDDVVFSPDGTLLATNDGDGAARLWDTTGRGTVEPLATLIRHTDAAWDLVLSPDGTLLATADGDNMVRLWDTAGRGTLNTPLATLTGHTDSVYSVRFSPDGTLLATRSEDGTARLWDTTGRGTLNALATLSGHKGWLWNVVFSPDGTLLATSGGEDGTARLWDTTGRGTLNAPLATLSGHTGWLWYVVFSPDGTLLATSGDDTVRLWDTTGRGTVKPLATLAANTDGLDDMVFSPDGTVLATSGKDDEDDVVRLWDTTGRGTVEPLATLTGHTGIVFDVVFSPDGTLLASAHGDNTVRLWDTTGRGTLNTPLATLTGHTDSVYSVRFSPDGTLLATRSRDGTARLWDLDAGRLVEGACADPANSLTADEWEAVLPDVPYDPPCA